MLINKLEFSQFIPFWCPRPDSNWHSLMGKDFKSFVSTDFTTRALPFLYITPLRCVQQSVWQSVFSCERVINYFVLTVNKTTKLLFSFSRNQASLRPFVAPSELSFKPLVLVVRLRLSKKVPFGFQLSIFSKRPFLFLLKGPIIKPFIA